ncbi:MAG: amidase family protein [Pseudomonadota bacterium]
MDSTADAARGWSAADQGRAIAAGRLDPVALFEAYLDAILSHPAAGLIYARLTPDRGRAEAEAARTRALDGRTLGPLDGVPVSWKDLFDTAGVATESGSRLLAGRTPTADAAVLVQATAAGSVCVGKTHLSELAFSGLGVNPMTATPPNRHGAALVPGGSSSGAAASLAFGLAPLAMGSDTGGSVRIPAAWNDLVGLKTTAGLLPLTGCVPLAPSLDTVGPLARSVEDTALALGLLSGEAAPALGEGDPTSLTLHVSETLGFDGIEEGIAAGIEGALTRLSAAGATVTRGPFTAFAEALEIAAALSPVVTVEGWQCWGETIEAHPNTLYPMIEARFRQGAKVTAENHAEALTRLKAVRDRAVGEMGDRGLIVMPTVPFAPPRLTALLTDESYYVSRNLRALGNTRVVNLLGLSAITIPTGTPHAGLMLIGPPLAEATLLRAGHAVERALGSGAIA